MKNFESIRDKFVLRHENIDDEDYLKKYINFLIHYELVKEGETYTEKHHILPRCSFPEYENEDWNIVELKYEDHKMAHLWLYKSINNRMYQRPLNWMLDNYKNSEELSRATKKGWINLKGNKEKFEEWRKKRSTYMSNLSTEEQSRRAKIFWQNMTDDEYSEFCNLMKSYWTDEKKLQKSAEMKNFYSNYENIIKKSIESKEVWDARDTEFRERFKYKMDKINKDDKKREVAGKKIKELWKSEEYLNKMKNRKLRGGTKIKLINSNGGITIFETMRQFEELYKFSSHLIRKYRNADLFISEIDLNESNIELKNCKIETING